MAPAVEYLVLEMIVLTRHRW